jgi:Undecaprenyl-phosphate glucose phosphotransferase
MLYRYSEVFRTLMGVADTALVASAWLAAYWMRFHMGIPAPLGHQGPGAYFEALAVILPVWFVLFRSYGIYEPQRTESLIHEAGQVIHATAVGIVVLIAIGFFTRSYFYSRGVVAAFSVLAPALLIGFRVSLRLGLRSLRRRGFNLRYVMVVGGGILADEIIERIQAHPEAGLRVRGVLAEGVLRTQSVRGVPLLGGYGALKAALHQEGERVDQVIIALPGDQSHVLEKVLADLDDEMVNVHLAPDLLHVMTLRASVENLDGLPIINLRESPMMGWAAVQKRCFDIALSSAALLLLSPLMALIGLAVAASSGRPVFYVQDRMGLDGHVFRMVKFRTMIAGAERESGPVWAREKDERRTRLGAFLRRFSLDELPQLWNVLRGDMSLVGPRPERPIFIEEFRREIPGYMLRHRVKAGLTGWAQVHGWRGNTSIHERVEHDLYYIQNWSLGLDLQILLMTLWRRSTRDNAY